MINTKFYKREIYPRIISMLLLGFFIYGACCMYFLYIAPIKKIDLPYQKILTIAFFVIIWLDMILIVLGGYSIMLGSLLNAIPRALFGKNNIVDQSAAFLNYTWDEIYENEIIDRMDFLTNDPVGKKIAKRNMPNGNVRFSILGNEYLKSANKKKYTVVKVIP